MRTRLLSGWLALALLVATVGARAHDSWLVPDGTAARTTGLLFGTGNRYPRAESAPSPDSVASAGCLDGAGRKHLLRPGPVSADGKTLALRSPAQGVVACWAELSAHEIELEPRLVEVYFREIRPDPAVVLAHAANAERGIGWHETYRKFARIERSGAQASPTALRHVRRPVGLPLEVVVAGDQPVLRGRPVEFRVLSEGKPVAGLSLEFVSERNPLGVWARSDAEGTLRFTPPFTGAWLVRGTLVEPAGAEGQWASRFVTLSFEVQ